tara:strand:+ start:475 stop:807 length:333 start_codon:yes stop_codon:yes gene_type:complete
MSENTLWRFVPAEADAFHAEQDELHEANKPSQVTMNNEDEPLTDAIEQCRKIVERKQCAVVGGKMMDMQTASVIVQIYDKLGEPKQDAFASQPIERMSNLAWKMVARLSN